MSARDDDAQTIAMLERELHRLRCEYRRVCEEADWKAEECRVLRRLVVRQDARIQELEQAVERLT